MLCSPVEAIASNGADFCKALGLPVSSLASPSGSLDHDCFNGLSTVGRKYSRLDIDYEKAYAEEERDNPVDDFEMTTKEFYDADYIDVFGKDIFDRIGESVLAGDGYVTGAYRILGAPMLRAIRNFWIKY
jgi:hypothetical protein